MNKPFNKTIKDIILIFVSIFGSIQLVRLVNTFIIPSYRDEVHPCKTLIFGLKSLSVSCESNWPGIVTLGLLVIFFVVIYRFLGRLIKEFHW